MQDESFGSPSAEHYLDRHGLHENTNDVVVLVPGWSPSVGVATSFTREAVESPSSNGLICWEKYAVSELRFSHHVSLLILQGLSLEGLFNACIFSSPEVHERGPFVLLAGQVTPIYRAPLAMSGLVLGRTTTVPKEISRSDLCAVMLQKVLFP